MSSFTQTGWTFIPEDKLVLHHVYSNAGVHTLFSACKLLSKLAGQNDMPTLKMHNLESGFQMTISHGGMVFDILKGDIL